MKKNCMTYLMMQEKYFTKFDTFMINILRKIGIERTSSTDKKNLWITYIVLSKKRDGGKWQTNQKGRNKTISISRWHDFLYRKYQGIFKKKSYNYWVSSSNLQDSKWMYKNHFFYTLVVNQTLRLNIKSHLKSHKNEIQRCTSKKNMYRIWILKTV